MNLLRLLKVLILLAFANVVMGIDVNIVVSQKEDERKSNAVGNDAKIIDFEEVETFELYDGVLKKGIEAHYGGRPDDVYVKSRTPWGDLYSTYNWPEVTRTVTPVKTEIFSMYYDGFEVMSQYINNTDKNDVTKMVAMRKEVENTVESGWKVSGALIGVRIHHKIAIKSKFGNSELNYDSNFGENIKKSEKFVIGPKNDIEVALKPGQRVKVVLQGIKGIIRTRINYEATVSGGIATNYNVPFKGHHFYYMNVVDVLSALELSRTAYFSEVITTNYYSDYEVYVQDVDTTEIINSFKA